MHRKAREKVHEQTKGTGGRAQENKKWKPVDGKSRKYSDSIFCLRAKKQKTHTTTQQERRGKNKNGTRINRCEESKRGKAKVFSALRK